MGTDDLFLFRVWKFMIAWELGKQRQRHHYYDSEIDRHTRHLYIGRLYLAENIHYRSTWPKVAFKWYGQKSD